MTKYLHFFQNEVQYQDERDNNYKEPWTSYIKTADRVDFNKTEKEKMLTSNLQFEITGDGTIYWKNFNANTTNKTIEYKKNDGEWISITSATGSAIPTIGVVAGDVVEFRGDNASYGSSGGAVTFSGTTCQFNVKGNIMSLVNSTGFTELKVLEGTYNFYYLFGYCRTLNSAKNLMLPATGLTDYCYQSMFRESNGLTETPELPATVLTRGCYARMFQSCYDLVSAPELPATNMAISCYQNMFSGCRSLTKAPELPSTNLANSCYYGMFSGCYGLTKVPDLPATSLSEACYFSMYASCSGITVAPVISATVLAISACQQMFAGCTSLVTGPTLKAPTLVDYAYRWMFENCTSLTYVKCLAENPYTRACDSWFSGVSQSGTFVKKAGVNWQTGNNGIPSNWTVEETNE